MDGIHVIVYGTPDCAFCKTEKQWLDSKGVKYDYVDITDDDRLPRIVERLSGGTAVPVTALWTIHEDKDNELKQVVKGFNRQALTEALGL